MMTVERPATESERSVMDAVVDSLGPEMADALDHKRTFRSGTSAYNEFVAMREIKGKMRRVTVRIWVEDEPAPPAAA